MANMFLSRAPARSILALNRPAQLPPHRSFVLWETPNPETFKFAVVKKNVRRQTKRREGENTI